MIPNTLTSQFSLPKLRLWLMVLFLLLALPIAALVWHAYGQLKWEAFHQHRGMAEELSDRISSDVDRYIRQADSRRFADYSFLVVAGDTSAPFLQRSPLSVVPVTEDVPGAIGYFQIDAQGKFSTPLLPGDDTSLTAVGIGSADFNNRELLATQLLNILTENQLVDEPLDTMEELAEGLAEGLANAPTEVLAETLADELAEVLTEQTTAEPANELAEVATQNESQFKTERAQENDLSAGAVNQTNPVAAPSQSGNKSQPIKKIDSQLAFDKLKSVVSSSKRLISSSRLGSASDTDEQQTLTNSTTAVSELKLDIRLEERSRAKEKAEQLAMPAIAPEAQIQTEDESNVESESGRYLSSEPADKQDTNRSTRTERNYVPELSQEILTPNSASSITNSSDEDVASTIEFERDSTALRETNASPILEQLGNRRITTFESDIDPMEISLLGSGHFVAYRTVWREGQRLIQGILIERSVFIDQLIRAPFQQATVSSMSSLSLIYQDSLLDTFRPTTRRGYSSADTDMNGALLFQNRLPAPLDTLELVFSIQRLPPGPGASVLAWVTAVLATVLLGGFYLLYRAGRKQIALSAQQQDFVSAVSHELKTPLTSIRMYGELLQNGWAPEEKKQQYYAYIQDESERLTRLIDNVLKLARINRNDLSLDMQSLPVADLMTSIQTNLQQQAESSGFEVQFSVDELVANDVIIVDKDSIMQIMVNLLDNAIKFSKHAERKSIEVTARSHSEGKLVLSVRDFGPGVPKDQLKNIFRMFYRSENELTRETVGTGIGLAIVNQLCNAMNADIDVRNCDPGVEFLIVVSVS